MNYDQNRGFLQKSLKKEFNNIPKRRQSLKRDSLQKALVSMGPADGAVDIREKGPAPQA